MRISVLIPTHNRLTILRDCLSRLEGQTFPRSDFEVVIVDDGSTDGTTEAIPPALSNLSFRARYVRQEQSGPAAARNRALSEASGEIVLFIGDDILTSPECLQAHFNRHASAPSPQAVIGKVEWDPALGMNPLMRALDQGLQFGFHDLTPDTVSYKHCYTANVSAPRSFVEGRKIFFDASFPYAAFEDIEWGYRLAKAGLRFAYEPGALGFHHHPVTLRGYCERMVQAGKALAYFHRLHPELAKNGKNTSAFRYFQKACKGRFRESVLKLSDRSPWIRKSMPGNLEERWIRSVLGYYLEKGIREGRA